MNPSLQRAELRKERQSSTSWLPPAILLQPIKTTVKKEKERKRSSTNNHMLKGRDRGYIFKSTSQSKRIIGCRWNRLWEPRRIVPPLQPSVLAGVEVTGWKALKVLTIIVETFQLRWYPNGAYIKTELVNLVNFKKDQVGQSPWGHTIKTPANVEGSDPDRIAGD